MDKLDQAVLDALGEQPFHAEFNPRDSGLILGAVNQGIDAHLTAVTSSHFGWSNGRLVSEISPTDLVVILRRLEDSPEPGAWELRTDILISLEIEE